MSERLGREQPYRAPKQQSSTRRREENLVDGGNVFTVVAMAEARALAAGDTH